MAKVLTQLAIDNLKPGAARQEIPDGKERGLYFVVQPTGGMSWAFRYRAEGKSRKLTVGGYPAVTLRQAREKAAKARATIADGRDPVAEKQAKRAQRQDGRDLVESVAVNFIERYAKPNQRPDTCRETERILNREIVAPWKGRRLAAITRADVHDLLDAISDRAPIQANRTLAALRRMCAWAVERGILAASPCVGIRAPAAERSRDRVLSDDELAAVWHACDGLGWPFGPLVRLLILTGQRRAEIAGMHWSEIDLDTKVWVLPKERAKNRIAHAVPLSDAAIAILKDLPQISGKGGLVFTTTGETSVAGFSRAKERLDAALPQDITDWTLHDLRRTFASGCARLGIAVHVVEAVLNHKSGTIKGVAAVYNRYTYDAEKRACLDAWARYIEAMVSGAPAGNVIELAAARV